MLNIQPLGGVGQIGSNMTLFQDDSTAFLIDCGILFPREDFFDINYLIPNFESLDTIPSDIIISHGHEDHIGAILHLIEKFPDIKIHAPLFARELILKKLEYAKKSHAISLFDKTSFITIGEFEIHPIQVNHSIPDTFGLLINNNESQNNKVSMFFISDFKIDDNNPYEAPFDFKKLNEKSINFDIKLLFADSTNITSSNLKTPSEAEVFKGLGQLINSSYKRIFITTFSSNIHRIQSIINIAKDMKYKVVPYGRSMCNYIDLALKTNHLLDPALTLIESKSVKDSDKNIIVLLTGCQGDFRGSLKRVTGNTDPLFKPNSDDLFIFSSKPIPGNEKKVYNIINDIAVIGAEVIYSNEILIHSSGHPGKEDLLRLYNNYKPTHIVPIHGEYIFLKKHCEYIDSNYKDAQAILMSNHDILSIDNRSKYKVKIAKNPLPPTLIHGKGLVIEKTSISQRRKLACNGLIFISIKIDSLTKLKLVFDYSFQGLPSILDNHIDEFESYIISQISNRKMTLLEKTAEDLRINLRRYFNNILGYKPIIIIHFV